MKIGISFSGGGFRATLFHLGVVRALRQLNLLSDIKHVSSVSGGSVLAAHLLLNWKKYNGSDEEFCAASRPLLELAAADMRGQILRRLPHRTAIRWLFELVLRIPGIRVFHRFSNAIDDVTDRLTATGHLELFYEQIYKKDEQPFENTTLESLKVPERDGVKDAVGQKQITVAKAVAASSAFPAFFTPIRIKKAMVHWDAVEHPGTVQFMTDGGVFDNLGISAFAETDRGVDTLIIVDACGAVDVEPGRRYAALWESVPRVIDVLMIRTQDLQEMFLQRIKSPIKKTHGIDIAEITRDNVLIDPDVQERSRYVRTDFDRFSAAEISCLVRHGYAAAVKKLQPLLADAPEVSDVSWENWPVDTSGNQKLWPSFARSVGRALLPSWALAPQAARNDYEMSLACKRHLRVLSLRDWISYAHIAFIAAAIILVIYSWRIFVTDNINWIVAATEIADFEAPTYVEGRRVKHEILRDDIFAGQPPGRMTGIVMSETRLAIPKYENVEFLADSRTFDMSFWTNKDRPVILIRRMLIKKTGPDNEIAFEAKTSGDGLFVHRVMVGDQTIRENKEWHQHHIQEEVGGSKLKLITQVHVNTRQVPVGNIFELTICYVYWNAFSEDDWAGALMRSDNTKRVSLLLFAPTKRPFGAIEYSLRDQQGNVTETLVANDRSTTTRFQEVDENGEWAFWVVIRPIGNTVYSIDYKMMQ